MGDKLKVRGVQFYRTMLAGVPNLFGETAFGPNKLGSP